MRNRIWAVFWIVLGTGCLAAELRFFLTARVDGTYGHETFYILFEILLAIVFAVPGLTFLSVGILKLRRENRARNPR